MAKFVVITYHKATRKLQIRSSGLFERQLLSRTIISTELNAIQNSNEDRDIAKRCKGIVVCSDTNGIRILNDPFCTLPLYYSDTSSHFIASSDPQVLIEYTNYPFDEVGVWETLLLDSPLWNRTPYRDVKFLPAACELNIREEIKLQRYWNFEFEPSSSEFNIVSFFSGLDNLLSQKFAGIRADTLCMGLSGGNDSRLAAYYVAKNRYRFSKIEFFTYASKSNSNEFKYARDVCTSLRLPTPYLHLLSDKHYLDALDYLPRWSAGQISNQHGHLSSYLISKRDSLNAEVLLSNYYTDAIFGFACGHQQPLQYVHKASTYQAILHSPHLPEAVREEMLEDCKLALSPTFGAQHFSSLDEFKYVVERNPRFHISLGFIQSQFVPVVLPFADFDVLTHVMKAPISLRKDKVMLSEFLRYLNPSLVDIGSSANTEYFYGSKSRLRNGTFGQRGEFLKFRLLNMISQLLCSLTNGRLRIGNPYQTEDQISVYRKSFSHMSSAVLANVSLQKCLGVKSINRIFKDNLILRNLSERFHLISFHHLTED